jgi:hypothetical protein
MQAARNDTKATREKARPRRGGIPRSRRETNPPPQKNETTKHEKKAGFLAKHQENGTAFTLKRGGEPRARPDKRLSRLRGQENNDNTQPRDTREKA